MTVRVKLNSEEPRKTLAELSADAGFNPKILPDGSFAWSFHNPRWGETFAIAAQYTHGVALVDKIP